MVTSVGMFGIEEAYGPIIPLSRLPLFLVVTEVRARPWVEDGKVVVRTSYEDHDYPGPQGDGWL